VRLLDWLFVYGSLRSDAGHAMHGVLAAAGERVDAGWVRGRLYAVAWYPGLVLDDGAGEVHGEVWRLRDASVLARLDSYEGCGPDDAPPHEFRRERTQVRLHGGATVSAWVYGYARAVDEARRVDSGDWAVRGC
jgi:gamma-glutamylcyclotransferase (GGCT)/AIG2-like uncharacterized protein YtfP